MGLQGFCLTTPTINDKEKNTQKVHEWYIFNSDETKYKYTIIQMFPLNEITLKGIIWCAFVTFFLLVRIKNGTRVLVTKKIINRATCMISKRQKWITVKWMACCYMGWVDWTQMAWQGGQSTQCEGSLSVCWLQEDCTAPHWLLRRTLLAALLPSPSAHDHTAKSCTAERFQRFQRRGWHRRGSSS